MTELELNLLEKEEQDLAVQFNEQLNTLRSEFCEKHNCFIEPIFHFAATPSRPLEVVAFAMRAISKKRFAQQAPSNIILPNGKRPS